MTSLNLALRTDAFERVPHAPRHERMQRPATRRSGARRPVDAADAALLAHWTRMTLAGEQQELSLAPDAACDAVATSGWFESTWELAKGLEISEVQMSELPLDGWLQLYLSS